MGFGGHSQGNGSYRLLCGKKHSFHVESNGYKQSDGTFRLDQTVTFENEPAAMRFWLLKPIDETHYEGTLSDAPGPVTAVTDSSRLLLEYRVKGPLIMHQILEFAPDRKTIDNVGTITLLGIPIGHLRETIVRKD